MAVVNVTYYGMDGTGKNLKEAKADAAAKVESAMRGTYQPVALESRGVMVVVWRDPYGWRSNTITEGGKLLPHAFSSYSSGCDKASALKSAISHLAQCTWDHEEAIPPCIADYGTLLTPIERTRLINDFVSWRGFQLAYRHAKQNGIGEGDCDWHRWACENGRQFQAA